MAELKPTHARTWRASREEGHALALPSGKVCRVRPVALDRLILAGKVPNLLISVVYKILWAQASNRTQAEIDEQEAEEKKYMLELVDLIVPAALVYPRLSDAPKDDDEISIDDLQFGDKITIFAFAKLPAETLEGFFREQAASVESLPASEVVRSAPEQPT